MHAEAERGSRGVVVYLLPGLTSAQRKAALRRLRQEGSRGCGPRLPSGQLAVALAVDQVRTVVNNTVGAVRQHPFGTLVPAALAGGLLAVFVSASVSVRVARAPAVGPGGGGGAASWTAPAGTPRGGPARPAMPPTGTAIVGGQPAGTPGIGSAAGPRPRHGIDTVSPGAAPDLAINAGAATAALPGQAAPGPPAAPGPSAWMDSAATSSALPAGSASATRQATATPAQSATGQPSPGPGASGAAPSPSPPAPKPGTPPGSQPAA